MDHSKLLNQITTFEDSIFSKEISLELCGLHCETTWGSKVHSIQQGCKVYDFGGGYKRILEPSLS